MTTDRIARIRKWAEEVNAAYADGGYAAGDGPNPPDPDDLLALCMVVHVAITGNKGWRPNDSGNRRFREDVVQALKSEGFVD